MLDKPTYDPAAFDDEPEDVPTAPAPAPAEPPAESKSHHLKKWQFQKGHKPAPRKAAEPLPPETEAGPEAPPPDDKYSYSTPTRFKAGHKKRGGKRKKIRPGDMPSLDAPFDVRFKYIQDRQGAIEQQIAASQAIASKGGRYVHNPETQRKEFAPFTGADKDAADALDKSCRTQIMIIKEQAKALRVTLDAAVATVADYDAFEVLMREHIMMGTYD